MNFFKSKLLTLLVLFVSVTVFLALTINFFNPPPKHATVRRVAAASISQTAKTCPADFSRDLKFGQTGADVKALQKYLNNNGFVVAKSGAGSKNKETAFFGSLTRQALSKFQKAENIPAASGVLDKPTRIYLSCLEAELPVNEFAGDLKVEANNSKYYTVGGKITGLAGTVVL